MVNPLFRQSFFIDSLYSDSASFPREYKTDDGLCLRLHDAGVLEVIPPEMDEQTKHIVISCGIHGKDAGPVEIVNRIVCDIESGLQQVQAHCLFVIAHIEAIKQNVQYIEEDLELLFDDQARDPSIELAIADNLKICLQTFWKETPLSSRWHFDLHSTLHPSRHHTFVISPKVRHPVRPQALVDFIELAHIEAIVLANAPSTSFSWYTADCFAACALKIELGLASRLGQSDLENYEMFDLALRGFIADEPCNHQPKKTVGYRISRTIVRMHENFDFLFPEDIENFTTFVHGEVFGHDGDKPLMAKNEGEAILFPNRYVSVGEPAAVMVCKVSVRFDQGQLIYD
jgi:succinylglutamate desuccinylase